ncbi:MAG: hypothetical protein M0T74_02655, partial [Desulfitobacterium hafniense]|nr:hypothetical protein [Desulfitobacterium hafniense]
TPVPVRPRPSAPYKFVMRASTILKVVEPVFDFCQTLYLVVLFYGIEMTWFKLLIIESIRQDIFWKQEAGIPYAKDIPASYLVLLIRHHRDCL